MHQTENSCCLHIYFITIFKIMIHKKNPCSTLLLHKFSAALMVKAIPCHLFLLLLFLLLKFTVAPLVKQLTALHWMATAITRVMPTHSCHLTKSSPYLPSYFPQFHFKIFFPSIHSVGWDSSVSIATRYGLDGPGIESRWGRDFPYLSRLPLGPTQPPVQWVPGLSRG